MDAQLAISKDNGQQAHRKRERIVMLERRPEKDWFVTTKSPKGRTKWYLRFAVTGMLPRLFGPFASRRTALLFLDDAIDRMCDFWTEIDDARSKHASAGEFEHVSGGPLIEYSLSGQSQDQKHAKG